MQQLALTAARKPRKAPRRAFTLVEILIVVTILGILAAIVVPQFVSANSESRDSAMLMNLSRIRTQLQIYQSQHNGDWPTLANFSAQMTTSSNIQGATAAVGTSGYPLGPYLQTIPINPWIPSNSIATTGVGTSGWYYNEATGDFRPNDSARTNGF
ncbi:MAG: prepilin-type N-terminal cleavage/methylation domain-containing protein [Planctomycetota bacterium]|nr:prepilin-type N-terminal cleavage/methylation domain-containing protein [Planctomycetota bacterium]